MERPRFLVAHILAWESMSYHPEDNLRNVTDRQPTRFRVRGIVAETVVTTEDGYHDEFTGDMCDFIGKVLEFFPNRECFEWWYSEDGYNWHDSWLEHVSEPVLRQRTDCGTHRTTVYFGNAM